MEWLSDLPLMVRVAGSSIATYAYVILLVRVSGKRTVAQMNSFDWIFNVAMGSLVASSVTKPDMLPESWTAMVAIVLLQWGLTRLTFHSNVVSKMIKAEPRLLVSNGQMITDAMAKSRVNAEEVKGAVRAAGLSDITEVGAMIFETDGSVSIIQSGDFLARTNIPGAPDIDGTDKRA